MGGHAWPFVGSEVVCELGVIGGAGDGECVTSLITGAANQDKNRAFDSVRSWGSSHTNFEHCCGVNRQKFNGQSGRRNESMTSRLASTDGRYLRQTHLAHNNRWLHHYQGLNFIQDVLRKEVLTLEVASSTWHVDRLQPTSPPPTRARTFYHSLLQF